MRRFLVVDPTLDSLRGHSYNYVRAIGEAAAEQFDEVVICADRRFRPPPGDPLRYEPVLNRLPLERLKGAVNRCFHWLVRLRRPGATLDSPLGIHASLAPNVWGWLIRLAQSLRARELLGSLERLLRARPVDRTTVAHFLIQHARIDELIAIERLKSRFRAGGPEVHVHLILRDSPGLINTGRFENAAFADLLLRLARSAQPRIHLFTDSARLTREYLALGVAPVGTLPVPVAAPETGGRVAHSPEIDIAFLGPARVEKGFCELARLVERLPRYAAGRRVRASIQVTRDSVDPRVRLALSDLRRLAQVLPRGAVEFLESPAPSAVYYSWIERADIVVLPYVSPKYSSSTSGIFVEAICLGVPVLCPAGSWMSDMLDDARQSRGLHIGEVFATIDEIPGLVTNMTNALAHYRADTGEYSATWRATHNPRHWLSTLLEAAG